MHNSDRLGTWLPIMFKNKLTPFFFKYYFLSVIFMLAGVMTLDWFYAQGQSDEQDTELLEFSKLVAQICEINGCKEYQGEQFQLINRSNIKMNLTAINKILTTTDEHYINQYVRINEQYYLKKVSLRKKTSSNLITIFFYFCLVTLLFFILNPLFKYMMALKTSSQQFALSHNPQDFVLPDNQFFSPISNTITWMINKISNLVLIQKDLSDTLSHEMRTIITKLRFLVASINANNFAQQQVTLNNEIGELTELVNEYLEYSKNDNYEDSLKFEPVFLNEIITELLDRYRFFNKSKTIIFECSDNVILNANKRMLTRAVKNLIENAVKYSTSQVIIRIEDTLSVKFIIEDDGPGISGQDIVNILEPYTRLSKTSHIQGYGLGLSITHKILNWHNATLNIDKSDALSGSRFEVDFHPPKK